MSHGTVRFTADGAVGRVTLARPDLRNAFNDEMLADLRAVFAQIREREDVRVVVLTGEGKAFCAGADLTWMKRVLDATYEENVADSLELVGMLNDVYACPKPVIGRVNGPAVGGGTGLVAACDIVLAAADAVFAFSETKLGLTPAAISPFLLKRMGERHLRRLFLTGERFSAERAAAAGLVDEVVPAAELDERVAAVVAQVLTGGPAALGVTKELIREIADRTLADNGPYTAEVIARLRMSDEGQEGMTAFLQKRKPRWVGE
jgi:methylglutaconyl-CoA hydratase